MAKEASIEQRNKKLLAIIGEIVNADRPNDAKMEELKSLFNPDVPVTIIDISAMNHSSGVQAVVIKGEVNLDSLGELAVTIPLQPEEFLSLVEQFGFTMEDIKKRVTVLKKEHPRFN